ncbi:MAG: neutral/alkaline non-lysosomal ceramidase N-terminal domain-containing protein [Candidatus Marinimicrobia bacterium]|nr:neutral/alkaline non-lysosomal ceramidase N-terminal domain-containing protein [Candidatus Neomarinimicrobiota bacterium]
MTSVMRRGIKVLGTSAVVLLVVTACVMEPVNRTPYKKMDYYRLALSRLDSLKSSPLPEKGALLKVGWAKVNMTPTRHVPLSGYGARKGAPSIGVHDSVYVRTFVFTNEVDTSVLITLDALIVPPTVTYELQARLPEIGYHFSQLFLTATHTHCSMGAWGDSWIGEKFAGDYDQEVVDSITGAILTSIQEAASSVELANLAYSEYSVPDLVSNRLVGDKGIIDPWFRVVKIAKASGATALITTFAAHATVLGPDEMRFSRDYPGSLVDSLEAMDEIDFAAFCAGAVGSHRPQSGGFRDYKRIGWLASELAYNVKNGTVDLPAREISKLRTVQLNLPLREPHWRIGRNWRLRPWLFRWLTEPSPAYLSLLRLGDIVFVGTPCDFSGELMPPIVRTARENGQEVLVTSFNGGYVGYITKDDWYDLKEYETFYMNWFGPYNGAYFVEIIQKMLALVHHL